MNVIKGVLKNVKRTDIKNGTFKIPPRATSIGEKAFYFCTNLTSITIPEGITSIGCMAFDNCSSLTNITIPKSVTMIDSDAFRTCSELKDITLPESLTIIGSGSFSQCSSLTNMIIPEGVTYIGHSAFLGCSSLTNITIPKSVTKIDRSAFRGCSSLTNITLPEGLTCIDWNVFSNCSSLTGITIPESVDSICREAFSGCSSLTSIKLPKKIEYLGMDCFDYDNVKINKDSENIILEKQSKPGNFMPITYLSHLIKTKNAIDFIRNADFKTFNSNIPNLKELLESCPEEEQLDFFKFAVALGCFSKEKLLDKNGKETESTVGQKASALLAKLIKSKQLPLGKYHDLFDSLPFDAQANQDFLNFISPQGKKNENLELLMSLENEYPGIFAKVMINFNMAKKYRNNGTSTTVSWEEALIKFYTQVRYEGVTEKTQPIAEVYGSHGASQELFDKAVNLHKKADETDVPEHILGKSIQEESILSKIETLKKSTENELLSSQELIDDLWNKKFTFEWLSKKDPRNGLMGAYVSCCGSISSQFYGRKIAESSITQKDVQNLVVKDSHGEIISKGTIYIDEEHGYGVFNDFELNQAYRKDEKESTSGRYSGDDKEESELKESEKSARENRDLIFSAFQRGIQAFVEEYDAQHPNRPLQQINIGMGYNRLKRNVEEFERATKLLTVPIEYGFQDASKEQYILYKRDEREQEIENTTDYEEK